MTYAPTQTKKQAKRTGRLGPGLRVSTMALLAAGALGTANPASAIEVTNAAELQLALNGAVINSGQFNVQIEVTGGDIDLGTANLSFGGGPIRGLGRISTLDGVVRTIENGTLTILSPSDEFYSLLTLDPSVSFDGDVVLDEFARLDIDGPAALGPNGTVTAAGSSEIRLFSFAGVTNTYDATFFGKITGVPNETTFAVVGNGDHVFTALPSVSAVIELNQYADFDDFSANPAVDPTMTLGATLVGMNNVTINTGTLDLADFDFTINSLSGVLGTEVTLGSGTLTTGGVANTTYSGVISGTGNLVKTGTGEFTLEGTNTYSGTTTVTEGNLILEGDQTAVTAVTVEDGGILTVNIDQTGSPTYTVENGGIINFNGDIDDATALTIDNGGLVNLGNTPQTIGALSGGGMLDLQFTNFVFGDATDTTFSGVIDSEDIPTIGNVTKNGTGNVTLSGVNTYNGTTTINEGTLTLDGSLTMTSGVTLGAGANLILNGDINDSAGIATGAGSTVDLNDNDETIASLTGTGDVTLGSATLTVGSAGNFTFGGTISETGGLTKQGAGTMTVSGAQTYTGATNITGGSFIANGDLATSGVTVASGSTFNLEAMLTTGGADVTVDDGGLFFGTSTIADDLTNNGTVTLVGVGAGDTINVGGDYIQGATGTLNIQIGNAGGLIVAGNANVSGTLNVGLPADPANFDINGTYTVIDAGSITSTFDTVTDDFAFLDLTNMNNGGDIEITLARNAVAINSITTNSNQAAVATVLDAIVPTNELDSALDRILASSEAGARQTLDALAGAGAATAGTQSAANAVNQSHRVLDQAVGVNPATSRPTGAFSNAPGIDTYEEADHLTLLSFYQGEVEEADEAKPKIAGLDPIPWGKIYGGFGEQGDGAEGLDYTRYGLIVGVELESDEREATYGLSLGVEQTDFEFNQSNGDVDITSLYLSGYTRQPLGNDFNFTVAGGVGYHSHDSTRSILIGVTPTQASADFDSFSISVAAEISKTFTIVHQPVDPGGHPTSTDIEPFVRIDYSLSDQDGYTESGAGTAGLNVASSEFDSVRAAFGVRVQHQYMFGNQYEAVLRGRALLNAALSNSDSDLNVSFVNTPGSNFAIEGSDQDDFFGQIGVGLSIEINDNWDFHIDLDQQIGDEALGTLIAAGLSYEF